MMSCCAAFSIFVYEPEKSQRAWLTLLTVSYYNESYGLGKDGIRREKAGRYENQGIQTIFGARRVP